MFSALSERSGLIAASFFFGMLCLHAPAGLFRVEAQSLSSYPTSTQSAFPEDDKRAPASREEPRTIAKTLAAVASQTSHREAEKRAVPATGAPTPPQTTVARDAAPAPAPPRLVTVVHRLRGWKLIAWLAANGSPSLELDALPSASESRTNVVAGLLTGDGRAVVARLPQVDVELETSTVPSALRSLLEGGDGEQSEFTVLLGDGRKVKARFVGFDAPSGLSLLETTETLQPTLAGDEGDTEEPAVGQSLRLFAPAPLSSAEGSSTVALHQEGELKLGIEQRAGMLTGVALAPTGKPFRLTAQAGGISSAWAGAIATDETGSLVGVVSQSASGRTQIVPAVTMRRAVERIMKERSSVPQPWLGARGDSVFEVPEEKWIGAGWKPEQFAPLMRARAGVMLTSVAPETPAAVAGLKAGDVIERVGEREVRGVDDLSFALMEQHVGATVDFTVRRPVEASPLRLSVLLSGTPNPALATAQAEMRAARAEYLAAHSELSAVRNSQASQKGRPVAETKAMRASIEARLAEAQRRLSQAMRMLTEAESRMFYARARTSLANSTDLTAPSPPDDFRPMLAFGMRTIGLTPRASARMGAEGGHLVISVDRRSPAEAAGIRPGDIVEKINGETPTPEALRRLMRDAPEWAYVFDLVRGAARSRVELRLVNEVKPSR